MPDPVNNNKGTPAPAEEGNLDWLGVKARGDFKLLFPTSATADGLGGSAGAEVNVGYKDRYYHYGVEWSRYDTSGDRGDGTASSNTLNVVDIVFGSTDRKCDLGGNGRVIGVTGRDRTIGVGGLSIDNSDHYSDGVTNGNEGSEKGMFLSSSFYGGLEFNAGERFVIFPKIGLSMSTFYPFNGVEEQSKWFASPRTIALLFGLSIGYNDGSSEPTQDAKLNDFDIANEFAGDAVDFLQLLLAHNMNATIAGGQGLLCDNKMGCGPSSQQTEDLAPLQAISSGFVALGVGDDVGFIHKAWASERRAVAVVKLVEKGVTGLVASVWGGTEGDEGADLLGSGLTNLQVVGAGLMSLSDIDPRAQDVIRWGVGTALLLLGGAVDNMGLVSGGMNGALGVTYSPDATNKKITSATTTSYYPWTIFNGEMDGNRGTLRKIEHLPLAKHWNLLTSSEISTPVLGITSAEGRAENAFTEKDDPYGSYFLATSFRSGLGVEYEWRLHDRVIIMPAIDVFAAQEFGSRAQAGIGAGAELALMIRLKDKFYLDLRSRVAVEKMIDGPTNTEIMPVALGFTIYNNKPFFFF